MWDIKFLTPDDFHLFFFLFSLSLDCIFASSSQFYTSHLVPFIVLIFFYSCFICLFGFFFSLPFFHFLFLSHFLFCFVFFLRFLHFYPFLLIFLAKKWTLPLKKILHLIIFIKKKKICDIWWRFGFFFSYRLLITVGFFFYFAVPT